VGNYANIFPRYGQAACFSVKFSHVGSTCRKNKKPSGMAGLFDGTWLAESNSSENWVSIVFVQ